MDTYAKYKLLIIKKEGYTSHVCRIYDQDSAKEDKYSFR